MTNRIEAIDSYNFSPGDVLLLDANVWLLIYAPASPNDTRVVAYSGALRKIIEAQSHVYIDLIVLTEFINNYARMKQRLVAPQMKFKDFRHSADFKSVAQDITADARRLLRQCIWLDNSPTHSTVDGLLGEYALGNSDFNDQIITTHCERQGLKLVTDDGDFKNSGIFIITANAQLLT